MDTYSHEDNYGPAWVVKSDSAILGVTRLYKIALAVSVPGGRPFMGRCHPSIVLTEQQPRSIWSVLPPP